MSGLTAQPIPFPIFLSATGGERPEWCEACDKSLSFFSPTRARAQTASGVAAAAGFGLAFFDFG